MTNQRQIALMNYLIAGKQHQEAEAKLGDDEFLPFDYSLITELNKHYTVKEVDHLIINKSELMKRFIR